MRRALVALSAALVTTALVLGPARSLLPGSRVAQLPDVSLSDPGAAHGGQAGASAAPAVAALTPGPNAARVSLAAALSDKPEQGYVLAVHLSMPDGKPLNEATVRYYEVVDLFGQREMVIGESTTDGQGQSSLLYLPAQLGPHEVIARSVRRGSVTSGEARTTFEATVAAPLYRSEPAPLSALSSRLPYGAGALVLFVWALLAFALISTARGVLSGARDHAPKKGDIA